MQTTSKNLALPQKEDTTAIFKMLPSSLSNVPFHENTFAITRYAAENFPVHLAIHKVSPVLKPPVAYTMPHVHSDMDEINIILSEHNLVYSILLGDTEHTVNSNSAIWIQRGMLHAANVLRGSGYFITLRIK